MRSRTRILASGVACALTIAIVIALLLRGSSSHPPAAALGTGSTSAFAGVALVQTAFAPPFALADVLDGRRVSLAEYRGRVVVLAFLYSDSACSACALIAQQVRGALDELRAPPVVLFVSVDPAADTARSVRRFLAQVSLSGRVRYLSGARTALEAAWRAYRIRPASDGRGAFERSAEVLLIDRAGEERVLYQQEQLTPEALAHDVGVLEGPTGAPTPG